MLHALKKCVLCLTLPFLSLLGMAVQTMPLGDGGSNQGQTGNNPLMPGGLSRGEVRWMQPLLQGSMMALRGLVPVDSNESAVVLL